MTKGKKMKSEIMEKNTIFFRKMPIISAGIQDKKNPKPTNQETHRQTPPKNPNKTQPAKKLLLHPFSVPWIEWQFSLENPGSNWLQLSIVLFIFFYQQIFFPVLSFQMLYEASLTLLLCFQVHQGALDNLSVRAEKFPSNSCAT